MLVLTRRIGESLIIADHIHVTLLSIAGRSARLGVDAPPAISVHRSEVWRAIQAERTRRSARDRN